MKPFRISVFVAAMVLAPLAGPLSAQEAASPGTTPEAAQEAGQKADESPALLIELNTSEQVEDACRISFMVENQLGADLSEAVFETVLFNAEGAVERLTLFDMRELPADRPRVRQFQIGGIACTDIKRILINGAQSCKGEGLEPDSCMAGLKTSSRIDIELLG